MPAITREEAIEQMVRAVESFPADELIELYNELFPKEAVPFTTPAEAVAPLAARIVAYLRGDRGMDQIVELLSLIVPRRRRVYYDETEDKIHYSEEADPLFAD
jgi:ATP-dependent protease Clp ATPase subunit